MTDRVHPAGVAGNDLGASEPLNPPPPGPTPPPPTYVIHVPKDQVYRVPPPENDYKFKRFTRLAERRRRRICCRVFCWLLAALLLLAVALVIAGAIMYFVFQPKLPVYTIDSLAISGFDVRNAITWSSYYPEFDAVVRANNPNAKISIDYRQGSSIKVSYSGAELAAGVWPAFLQDRKNVSTVPVAMAGQGIRLSDIMRTNLAAQQKKKAVPFRLFVEVPVRVSFGRVTTWTITVKARCDVTVDGLSPAAKVTANACGAVKVNIF